MAVLYILLFPGWISQPLDMIMWQRWRNMSHSEITALVLEANSVFRVTDRTRYVRFEVLTVVNMKISGLWDVTPCHFVWVYIAVSSYSM
jgi:hypothetical protein